jgi:SAM-dependent methyltransferase
MTDLSAYPHVSRVTDVFSTAFPYFKGTIDRQQETFGTAWLEHFEREMTIMFGGNWARFDKAITGYGRFALDSMKLQKLFDKTRRYTNKSYAEAASEVYQNRAYMFDLYLPGILLSHFLWRHHYKQHHFYVNQFLPRVRAHGGNLFYDVGVGTGFYSKEMLRATDTMRGQGFDLSPFSLEFTGDTLTAFDLRDRYTLNKRDIINEPVSPPAPFVLSIEVLEHLEDPQSFLDALCRMLAPGGFGLISAALTAPNADHIYLYNEPEEVIGQMEKAGFKIVDFVHDAAYEPRRPSDSVPRNLAVIVTR